jgi:pSer/pThr/pTyr-binding forkhead associated (FHA) protein
VAGPIVLALRLLAAAALYAFLALALWTMWRQIQIAGSRASAASIPPIKLGVKRRGQRAVAHTFSQAEVLLGRDPLVDMHLPDKSVSIRHARASYHDGQWWLEDLGSTNGTRLNGAPLGRPTVLADGDEIKCGSCKVVVGLAGMHSRKGPAEGGHDE